MAMVDTHGHRHGTWDIATSCSKRPMRAMYWHVYERLSIMWSPDVAKEVAS